MSPILCVVFEIFYLQKNEANTQILRFEGKGFLFLKTAVSCNIWNIFFGSAFFSVKGGGGGGFRETAHVLCKSNGL